MRLGPVTCLMLALASGPALAQSRDLPTPATPGANPGAAATDAIVNPTKPAPVAPRTGGTASDVAPPVPPDKVAPPAPRTTPAPPATPLASAPGGEMRELLDTARAIAKSTQDTVEYGRVVPDILTQVLAKLDKLENKLDKIEDLLRASPRPRR